METLIWEGLDTCQYNANVEQIENILVWGRHEGIVDIQILKIRHVKDTIGQFSKFIFSFKYASTSMIRNFCLRYFSTSNCSSEFLSTGVFERALNFNLMDITKE